MISWPAQAARYVEQQGNDKLGPLEPLAMWSSKAMMSWPAQAARHNEDKIEQTVNDKLARSGHAP